MDLTSKHFAYLEQYFSGSQCRDAKAIGAWMRVRAEIIESVQNQLVTNTRNKIAPRSCLTCENYGIRYCVDCMQFSHYKARLSPVA